ncbi:MAG: BrnA antitoxin family protein [Acidobacteriota bacterium]|nr:BrnA antitoxin family protein [Acidobacteriota bacterium]
MKINELKKKLHKDRAMTTVSLKMPEDVVEDLKRIAPRFGLSGYESLIRAYVGQGLRVDLERLEAVPELSHLIESLRRRGVPDDVIASAVAEAKERVEAA